MWDALMLNQSERLGDAFILPREVSYKIPSKLNCKLIVELEKFRTNYKFFLR